MFVFSDFAKKVKLSRTDVELDNIIFRLHYRVTFIFLMACTVLVSSRQFIKDHINCFSDKYLEHVIDTYCFFSTTFTVVKYHNSTSLLLSAAAHPGVGPYSGSEKIVHHNYYQWVPFVLFGQAILFYVPRMIWKKSDNGRLAAIVHQMRSTRLIADEDRVINGVKVESQKSRSDKVDWLSHMYISMSRFRVSRDWAMMLVLCEFLNGLNLLVQIWWTNVFLQGRFVDLGVHWWNSDEDYVDGVFPKVTKCTFHKYGASGNIQTHDTICIMSLNIINEKIYVLLWFWFIILFALTSIGLFWRCLTLLFHNRSYAFNRLVWGEVSPGPALYSLDVETLTRELCFSDWMFLYYIGKNIDGRLFRLAVSQISLDLARRRPNRLIKLEATNTEDDPKESFC
ncbi:Innexin [Nesidiocoris tenuis]|uniref:Innexin n=1 Tax=Nesidiocoris tenuis TaxID=355587 RepID=A0ABN7AM28_9HEMI|nr:Innexin [Nesidiocoris tenuis]